MNPLARFRWWRRLGYPFAKWITNIRDAKATPYINLYDGTPAMSYSGFSICVTCQKKMPVCWDTVCLLCGDTSCYAHSHLVGQNWYCERHIDGVTAGSDKIKLRPRIA